jgi:hypothetical protein
MHFLWCNCIVPVAFKNIVIELIVRRLKQMETAPARREAHAAVRSTVQSPHIPLSACFSDWAL